MNQGQVSVSLVERDKILPLRELQVDEETNSIKFVVENEDTHMDDEIVQFQIETDNTHNYEHIQLDDIDVDSLIIENGVEKNYEESLNRIKIINRTKCDTNSNDVDTFEKEMRYPCDICGKIYEFQHRLKAHKRRTHFKKSRVYICNICGYKNNTLSGMFNS